MGDCVINFHKDFTQDSASAILFSNSRQVISIPDKYERKNSILLTVHSNSRRYV